WLVPGHPRWWDAVPVRGASHADRLAEGVNRLQSHHIDHCPGAGVVADDDHHHQRVTKLDGKARLQMLETTRIIVLIPGLDGYWLIQGQFTLVYGLERRHHNGDLTGTGRRDHHVAMAVGCFARAQVFQVPAGVKRQFVAELVEVG